MRVLEQAPVVSPNVTAGLFLCARELAAPYGLEQPSAARIVEATGAGRSRAYELKQQLLALLPTLAAPPGRPRVEREPAPCDTVAELRGQMLRFLMKHPGAVHTVDRRARYSDGLRSFVLALRDRHESISLADFADALCVPAGTLEDWLRAPPSISKPDEPSVEHEQGTRPLQLETVLDAWRAWSGDFGAFCDHVRREHRLELGNTMISSILFTHGERTPVRRGRRSRDESALRGAFQTFFPGAQWVADGKTLELVIDGEVLHVNLELVVDAATDAAVGISVRDEEDAKAVVEAFQGGVDTAAEPPLALLLDNRPSNHTTEVDDALGATTMRIRATPERPQNKAHVEGAFGLFAQKVPPIAIDTRDANVLARQLALLVATVFFRALNRAPRRDRDGRTRVDLYAEQVSPEQREAARKALHERLRRQELARQTRAARLDPRVRALLDDAFERLDLLDPERHLRDAIACYPLDAVVDAIAIFSAMRERGPLKPSMDGRYLLGIVRNLHQQHESVPTSFALMRERRDACDRFLAPLVEDRDAIVAAHDTRTALDDMLERLVVADRAIDRYFWVDAIVELLAPVDEQTQRALMLRAARRVHAAFRLSVRERSLLERLLLRRMWPLD